MRIYYLYTTIRYTTTVQLLSRAEIWPWSRFISLRDDRRSVSSQCFVIPLLVLIPITRCPSTNYCVKWSLIHLFTRRRAWHVIQMSHCSSNRRATFTVSNRGYFIPPFAVMAYCVNTNLPFPSTRGSAYRINTRLFYPSIRGLAHRVNLTVTLSFH